MKLCAHCGTRRLTRPRGLCKHCYDDLDIRYLYVVPRDEPSMADVERIIAEQLPTMPTNDDCDDERQPYEKRVVRVATRSRPLRW